MLKVYGIPVGGADRHEAARTLLRWKYEEIWQRPMPEIVTAEDGKLSFAEGPGFFCLAYAGGRAFCALCDSSVGLDVERIHSVGADVARQILTPEEWNRYSASKDPAVEFLQIRTLKEAYLKWSGQGRCDDPRRLSFDQPGEHPVLRGREDLRFWSKQVGDYVISLCSDQWHRPEFYWEEL